MNYLGEKQVRPTIGKSGCYGFIHPSQPDFQLPLKSFYYDVEIVECFTQVKLTQIYYNSSSSKIDVEYIFPVHANSTISSLEVSFAGKKVTGVVMEKEIAEKKFEQQVKEGAQAAYSEYNPKSRDIVKLKVGNINKKQEIKVVLCYTHLNSLVANTFYEFRLASTITPRYASQLDQSKLFFRPSHNSEFVQGKCYWGVNVIIKSKKDITNVKSPTHQIRQQKKNKNVQITFNKPYLPDKDFSLYYSLANFERPTWTLANSDSGSVAAISFIPKYCSLSEDDAFKQAKEKKEFQVDIDTTRGQYIFLLDRSGSMGGIRIQNAKRSLEIFLRSLPQNNYFNVVSFGSIFEYLFQNSPKNTKDDVDKAVSIIQKMDADMGGTEVLMVLQNIAARPLIQGYPRLLFFLTDGAVSNVSDVLEFAAKHTQKMRINSIGIGDGCSQELIQGCAEKGKGLFIFIQDKQRPEKKIIALLENAMSPVITNIKLDYDVQKVESIVPNPLKLPFILKNDLANFYFNFNGRLNKKFLIKIQYQDSIGNKHKQAIQIDPQYSQEGKWLHSLISSQKIRALCDSLQFYESEQDRIFFVKKIDKEKLKDEVIEQSIKHQILTQYTAFICVNDSIADQIRQQVSKEPKKVVHIKGMNPYDHKISVVTEKQGYNQEDESDCYIDQCCVASWEPPPKQLEDIFKFEETPKIFRKMPLKGRKAGKPGDFLIIQGTIPLPNPQKNLPFMYISKKQLDDGSWNEDFLDSLFLGAEELRKALAIFVDNPSEYITFLVCQYLERYYGDDVQYSLLIKKGKKYVEKISKGKWAVLQAQFHNYYKPLN